MRRSVVFLLFFIALLSSLTNSSEISRSLLSDHSISDLQKSLLPPKPPKQDVDIALVAALDGTVYMVDIASGKVRWSFSSGSPIYSASQANFSSSELRNDLYYVDCGDDWELYLHSKRFGKLKKFSLNPDEYIKLTPHVSDDGEVTLGYRKTTVFLVDARTGDVINTFGFDNFSSIVPLRAGDENAIVSAEGTEDIVGSATADINLFQHLVYIRRTDYEFKHKTQKGEVLWTVGFANIDAEFRCNGNAEQNIGSKDWQFPCSMKTSVLRVRDQNILEFEKLASAYFGNSGKFLPDDGLGTNLLPIEDQARILPSPIFLPGTEDGSRLALPASEVENLGAIVPYIAKSITKNTTKFSSDFVPKSPWTAIAFLLPSMILLIYNYLRTKKVDQLPAENVKLQPGMSKKKKTRKSGNGKQKSERGLKEVSLGNKLSDPNGYEEYKRGLPTFDAGLVDRRRIGKLFVYNNEIAKGSNGTVVLEGRYDGRTVAVKRLVQTHHDVASKEIQNLIASDQHPNIVRWYGVEYDQDFIYLALERCSCSLNDLISAYGDSFQSQVLSKDLDLNSMSEYTVQLRSLMERHINVELWKPNGYPSAQLLKLMRDVVSGLAHLHELGIIHRDLKPQNVLIINKKPLCAKISDMGISKRLLEDKTSTQNTTGHGSSGWQAPEQLLHERQTRAVDLFSLGCVLFFCMTGGKHPFGDSIERDVNIVNGHKDLFLVENVPEAVDLFSLLLDRNPDNRPRAQEVLNHPLFWTPEKRLSFLQDVSDRVELEDREEQSKLLDSLESIGTVALNGTWDEKMEAAFINNIGRYRRYKYDSIRDLLRVIRNKSHHYRELPQDIRELLGSHPEGFESYFSSRFPKLLIEVYNVILRYCKEDGFFHKYTRSNIV